MARAGLALAITAAVAPGCAPASRFEPSRPREVLVEVLPRDAEVRLDGRSLGRGSRAIPAPSGDVAGRTLAFRAEGFISEELALGPGGAAAGTRVGAALRPEGFPGPPLGLEDAFGLAAAADFLVQVGDPADARDYAERALALEPRFALGHRALADARAAMGDAAGAAESWAEYLRLAPAAEDGPAVKRRIEEFRSEQIRPAGR